MPLERAKVSSVHALCICLAGVFILVAPMYTAILYGNELFCFASTNQPHTLLFLLRFRYDSLVAVFSSLTMDNSIAHIQLDVVYLCLYSIAWSNYINFNSNAHMKAQTSSLFYKTFTQLTQSL